MAWRMTIDKQFIKNLIAILDLLVNMTHDKLVWQNLAIPLLGDEWKSKFAAARSDSRFLGEQEMTMANVRQMRD